MKLQLNMVVMIISSLVKMLYLVLLFFLQILYSVLL